MKKLLLIIQLLWILPIMAEIPMEKPDFIWNYSYEPDSLYLPQNFNLHYFNEKLYVSYLSRYISDDFNGFTNVFTILDKNGMTINDIAYHGSSNERYSGICSFDNFVKLFTVNYFGHPKLIMFNDDNIIKNQFKDSLNGRISYYKSHNYVKNDTMFVFDKDKSSDSIFIRIYDKQVNLIKKTHIDTTGFDDMCNYTGWINTFVKLSDNSYIIPFENITNINNHEIYPMLSKISSKGNLLWSKRYTIAGYDTTEIYDVLPYSDNSILVTALSIQDTNRLFTTTKLNIDGEILWRNELKLNKYYYINPLSKKSAYKFIQNMRFTFLLYDETLTIISGYKHKTIAEKTDEGKDTLLLGKQNNNMLCIDKNGNTVKELLWKDGTTITGVSAICESPDGNLILAGSNSLISYFVAKIKFDPNTSVHNSDFMDGTISISPNPAEDYVEILVNKPSEGLEPSEGSEIEIYDVLGNVVINYSTPSLLRNATPQEGNFKIDVSHLPKGVYFVKIGNMTEKFVKM